MTMKHQTNWQEVKKVLGQEKSIMHNISRKKHDKWLNAHFYLKSIFHWMRKTHLEDSNGTELKRWKHETN